MNFPPGVYAVTVGPDISEEPVRFLFLNETDADRFIEECQPDGIATYEPIAYTWNDPVLQEYMATMKGES